MKNCKCKDTWDIATKLIPKVCKEYQKSGKYFPLCKNCGHYKECHK